MSPQGPVSAKPLVSQPARGREHTLAGDAQMLRRRWKTVLGVVVWTVAIFAIFHLHSQKTYSATASVTFQNNTLSDAALNIATGGSSEPQREADTEVLIAHSAEVAEAVRAKLVRPQPSVSELLGEVKVEAAPTADVLNVIATTADPTRSAELANAFAAQYIAFRTNAQLQGIASAQRKIQEQIAALPAGSPEKATLEQTLVRLGSLQAVAGSGANVIGRATPPSSPSGSGWSVTIAIALLVGFAIAFSLVFLLESFDRRVRSIEDFEAGYRLPALAAIPHSTSVAFSLEDSDLLEPYRILRSALEFSSVARELNTLLVTSAVSGEGKSTVAINLARVYALSGRRTVIVELDLRRPETIGPFDLAARRGVTNAITGQATAEDLLVRPVPALPNLLLLPSGTLPHNPSEMLGSPRVTDLIAELRTEGTMVIIDTAPLNPVADAQVLLSNPAIDGAIIVARLDRLTRDEMGQARAILDHHRAEPLGLVVTDVRDTRRYGYGYDAYGVSPDAVDMTPPQGPIHVLDETIEARVVSLEPDQDPEGGPRRDAPRLRRTPH